MDSTVEVFGAAMKVKNKDRHRALNTVPAVIVDWFLSWEKGSPGFTIL